MRGLQNRFGLQAEGADLAARGYNQLATAIGNVNDRLQRQGVLAQQAANSNRQMVAANPNRPAGSGYSSNIAAQLQDVAVTAQYANPIQVALQQGTQLSAVFNDLKRDGQSLGPALAGAFMSIVNPVSLLTLGTIAAGVAAYQYFTSGSSEAEKLNKKLQEQEGLIGRVAARWGEAYPALKEYADQLERAANAGQLEAAQTAASERRIRELMSGLDLLGKRAPEISQALRGITSPEGVAANQQYLQSMTELRTAIEAGKDPSEALGRATTALGTILEQTGSDKVRSYAEQFGVLAGKISEAARQSREFRMQMPDLGTLGETWAEGGKIYNSEQFIPRDIPTPTRRPLIELEGLPGEVKQNEAAGRSYRDVIKSAQDRIQQMELEAVASGKTGVAAQRLRFELELLQDAQDKGRKITPEQRKEIEQLGNAYQKAASQAALADYQRSQEDRLVTLRAELALVGQTEDVRSRTLALLQAERQIRQMGLSSSSQEAAQIRSQAEALSQMEAVLDRQRDAWRRFQSAGESAIDGIVDKLSGGDLTGALEEVKNAITGFAMDDIKAGLKNGLLGTNQGTTADVGGFSGVFGSLRGETE